MKRKIKVILVMVTSVNGKSTKGTQDPRFWASKEDQEHFYSVIDQHDLLVMGRITYQSAKPYMKLESGKLRIVITKNPKKFQKDHKRGQLEFTNDSPSQLVHRMEKIGARTMLLLGGGTLNSLFFKQHLVDELWLTVEPFIFFEGKGLVRDERLEISLELLSMKKLNKNGTLLLKYKIKK